MMGATGAAVGACSGIIMCLCWRVWLWSVACLFGDVNLFWLMSYVLCRV
jgi:hypothetical protein